MRVISEPGQRNPRGQDAEFAAISEPRPATRPVPIHKPGRPDLRHRGGRNQFLQLRRGQPGQLGRAAAVRVRDGPGVVIGRDVGVSERSQRGGQDVFLCSGCGAAAGMAFTSVQARLLLFFEQVIASY